VTLANHDLKSWRKMWVVPEINGEFIERMEDVLRIYALPYDLEQPVVCLDERPVVLRDSARSGSPMRAGRRSTGLPSSTLPIAS
jgi:hypothetical protein